MWSILNSYCQASSCVSKQRTTLKAVNIISASISYTTTGEYFFPESSSWPGYGLSMLVWLHHMVHWSDDMTDSDRWMVHPKHLLASICQVVTNHQEKKVKDMLNHHHNMKYELKTWKHKVRLWTVSNVLLHLCTILDCTVNWDHDWPWFQHLFILSRPHNSCLFIHSFIWSINNDSLSTNFIHLASNGV